MSLFKRAIRSFKNLFKFKSVPRRKKKKNKIKPVSRKRSAQKSKRLSRPGRSPKTSKKQNASIKKESKPLLKSQTSAGKSPKGKPEETSGKLVGKITHYFSRIAVAVVDVKGVGVRLGDKIFIKGKNTSFAQNVKSLQVESVNVKAAHKGQVIGLKVDKEARVGDKVFKLG